MEAAEILREFELTDNEVKIYLLLLEESSPAGDITNKTGIHRRNVYDSIERLVKKGLVGYVTQKNRKYFTATDPKHLLSLLEKEKETLRKREASVKKILPHLQVLKAVTKTPRRVTVFEGRKGLIYVLEDVLREGKPNIVFSTPELKPIQTYLHNFHRRRVQAGVHDKILSNKKDLKRVKALAKLPMTEIRLTNEEFDSPFVINVYGDKVGMLITTESPIAILIEDKEVANSFRKYFSLLWRDASRVL